MGESQWTIESGVPLGRDTNGFDAERHGGPRNPDGTWMAGVVRGPFKPFPVEVGFRRGALTVIGWVQSLDKHGKSVGWNPKLRCDCGWEGVSHRSNFLNKRTMQCDECAKKAANETRKKYWGYADIVPDSRIRESLLNRIAECISRCERPTHARYHQYGGRGIRVHPEWVKDRKQFLRYIVSLDGWDKLNLELDRIDNNKGYEPGNLRWSTRSENVLNRRKIDVLQARVQTLEAENADLRYRLERAEKQIHGDDK